MNTGSVSLRFWHPTRDLSFLSSLLGLPCSRSWKAGEHRKTPKGVMLPGENKKSYWASRLEYSGNEGFKKQLVFAINRLMKAEQGILKFTKSGGEIEIYLQLSGNTNHGGSIDNKYIQILGKFGIDLLIEVFP